MLHLAANSHPAPHINGFLWPLLQPTGIPGPHIIGFLWASKSTVCQPSCSQQAPQGHTSMASPQGHTSMASYGHPSLPFASPLAANRHPRATHQWLLMGVQVCRLPEPPRATHQWLLMATLAANRHPRATHHWLLMGVQVCRLPALKPLKPSKRPNPPNA